MFLYIILSGFFLLSCTPETKIDDLIPPPTPVLTSQSRWGLISKAYVKLLAKPASNADVNALLRKGDIVEIEIIRNQKGSSSYWIKIHEPTTDIKGWMQDDDLEMYESELQARIAGNNHFPALNNDSQIGGINSEVENFP